MARILEKYFCSDVLENRFVKLPSPEEEIPLGIFFTQRIHPKNMCHARRHLFKFAEFRCLEMGHSRPSGSSLESGEELDAGATFLSLPNREIKCYRYVIL